MISILSGRKEPKAETSVENDNNSLENEDNLEETRGNFKGDEDQDEEKSISGESKNVRKRKVPNWRKGENEETWEEEDDGSDYQENVAQLFGKRKSYSPRKNKFSLEQKGVRMLQTPVSRSNKNNNQTNTDK